MVRAVEITTGRVAEGTRFRSAVVTIGCTAETLIEGIDNARPTLLASAATMQPTALAPQNPDYEVARSSVRSGRS
jgi:hypothetical protein